MRQRLLGSATADKNGTFQLSGVVPGDYLVAAFRRPCEERCKIPPSSPSSARRRRVSRCRKTPGDRLADGGDDQMRKRFAAPCGLAALVLSTGVLLRAERITGILGGVVSGPDAQPMRRVVVTLTSAALPAPRVAMTDDEGRFSFDSLAEGNFNLTAARPGFLTTAYGATRGWRSPGIPIALKTGERLTTVAIRMTKGGGYHRTGNRFGWTAARGAVDQRPRSAHDQRARDIRSRARQRRRANSQHGPHRGVHRRSRHLPNKDFRLGHFCVSAYQMDGDPLRTFEPTSSADLDWARATAPNATRSLPDLAVRNQIRRRPLDTYPFTSRARQIRPPRRRLRSRSAKSGRAPISSFRPCVSRRNSGQLTGPAGEPVSGVMLFAVAPPVDGALHGGIPPMGGTDAQGRSTIAVFRRAGSLFSRAQKGLFGQASVDVQGAGNLSGVNVQMLPGVSVSGRVVMADGSALPAEVLRARIRLTSPPSGGVSLSLQPVELAKDGTFKFEGLSDRACVARRGSRWDRHLDDQVDGGPWA